MILRYFLKLKLSWLAVLLVLIPTASVLSQEQKADEVPPVQTPVQERDSDNSTIETIGELPGKIIVLPLKLVFTGVSLAARLAETQTIVPRITDWLTSEDGNRKVRPIFTPVSGGGVIFVQNNLPKKGMRIRAVGSFGARTRRYVYGGLRDLQLFSPKLGLKLEGFHQRLPDEDFWGIGNNSRQEDETSYLHEESHLTLEVLSNGLERVIVGAGFSYSNVTIEDGRDSDAPSIFDPENGFTESQVPGIFGAEMATFQLKIYRDTRNRTANPTKGTETLLSYHYAREIGGSSFGYNKFTADVRRYIHLFYNRVLVLRLQTEITDPIGSRTVPFFRLGGLGGRENLRGFARTRLRDRDYTLFGAEYRFPIHSLMDALVFGEEGRVFSDVFDEFSLDDFKYSIGGGLRVRGRDGNLVALLEIAKSPEDLRVYFELNKNLRRF